MTDFRAGRRPLALAPFRGLRYAPDRVRDLGAVTSPPYDVLDEQAIAALEAAEPYNIVRVILPRASAPAMPPAPGPVATPPPPEPTPAEPSAPAPGHRPHEATDRYREAARLLDEWRKEGVLVVDPTPALYVYEQQVPRPGRASTAQPSPVEGASHGDVTVMRGIIGALSLRTPDEQVVLPHEDTMPGPVADRLALMRSCAANLEPILLAYDGGGATSALVERTAASEPLVEVRTSDGALHRMWRITSRADHAAVAADLAGKDALIADGHHRYATYLRLQQEMHESGAGPGPWDEGLALLVDQRVHPLQLTAIHRFVPGLPLAEVCARAAETFEIDVFDTDRVKAHRALAARRGGGHALLLTDATTWVLLRRPADAPEIASGLTHATRAVLDVDVLHDLLFDRLLGIPDERIGYAHDDATAVAAAAKSSGTAVLLNPVDLDTVVAVARSGGRMPRKSTSFGPKPRTGFIMRAFSDDER